MTNPTPSVQQLDNPTTHDNSPVVSLEPQVIQPNVTPPVQAEKPLDINELDQATLLKSKVVQTLLGNARTEEKNKLYAQLTAKDETIKKLTDEIGNLKTELANKEENLMGNEKELLAKIEDLGGKVESLLKDIEIKDKEVAKAKIDTYKADKLREAGDEIITALVHGNTIEEIDASIEVAKREYELIAEKEKAKLDKEAKPKRENAPKPTSIPAQPLEFSAEDIKNMSPTEYAQHRERIIKNARQL